MRSCAPKRSVQLIDCQTSALCRSKAMKEAPWPAAAAPGAESRDVRISGKDLQGQNESSAAKTDAGSVLGRATDVRFLIVSNLGNGWQIGESAAFRLKNNILHSIMHSSFLGLQILQLAKNHINMPSQEGTGRGYRGNRGFWPCYIFRYALARMRRATRTSGKTILGTGIC